MQMLIWLQQKYQDYKKKKEKLKDLTQSSQDRKQAIRHAGYKVHASIQRFLLKQTYDNGRDFYDLFMFFHYLLVQLTQLK